MSEFPATPRTGPDAAAPAVVVLGGGYGGIVVARALDEVANVVLVEPKDAFVHNVAALRALADPSWLPRIYFPYERLLSRGRVVQDRAVKADAGHVTLSSGEEIRADYLVLATGSQYPFPAKSDADDAATAHQRVRAAHAALGAAGRVLLVGAGAVGIELAGEIAAFWPGKQVTLLDAADDVLGARFRPDLKAELRRQLTAAGVRVLLSSPLRQLPAVPPAVLGEFTVQTQSGAEITADIWFRCFGVSPVSDYLSGELAAARGADGFITATPYLQVTGQERVFALGDVADADHKTAGAAGRQAQVVAANIRALIEREAAAAARPAGAPAEQGPAGLTAYEPAAPSIVVPVGPAGGAGQRAGADELLAAEVVAELKGRDMMVERFAGMFGLAGDDESPG